MGIVWLCRECAEELLGHPFEEKPIAGVGDRSCARCGCVRKRDDRMHLVAVAETMRATFRPGRYPFPLETTVLRRRADGLYEQRKETWEALGPVRGDELPCRLQRSEPTGRVFGATRAVTLEALFENGLQEATRAPDEVIAWTDPESWAVTYLIQVEGDAEDLTCDALAGPVDRSWYGGVEGPGLSTLADRARSRAAGE